MSPERMEARDTVQTPAGQVLAVVVALAMTVEFAADVDVGAGRGIAVVAVAVPTMGPPQMPESGWQSAPQ